MRYEKYKINKLFTSQNGDTDIKKSDITGTGVPVITSGVDKYGIMGETDIEARIIKENTITIDMFGNAFFRPFKYKMVTHARVFSMELIGREMTESIGLFLVSHFHWLPQVYNYSNMCSFNKIKDSTITLPTLDELDENSPYSDEGFIPDWDYMEKRVSELEEIRVSELAAYLEGTGLSDYILTEREEKLLSAEPEMVEFKVSDLFNVSKGRRLTKQDRTAGHIPLLTAGVGLGQGVAEYIAPNDRMALVTDSITIDMFGSVFYHDYETYGDDNIHFLVNDDVSDLGKLYITTVIQKRLANQYSYGRQFRMTAFDRLFIELPVLMDTDDKYALDDKGKPIPDWYFMEKYIRAIEKIVIADVVKYKDEIIAKTKSVVG